MSESKAKETPRKVGYKYDLQYKQDSTVTKGNVISQSTSGSTVTSIFPQAPVAPTNQKATSQYRKAFAAMRGLAFYANYSPQTRVACSPFADSPILSPGSHASSAKSAPPGAIRSLQKQESDFLQLFRLGDSLSCSREAKQSIIWTIYCVFEPISAFCRSATIPNRKKLQLRPIFCFQPSKRH